MPGPSLRIASCRLKRKSQHDRSSNQQSRINNQQWSLISNCPSVVPVIAGTEALAGLRIDGNTFRVAPVGRNLLAFVQAKLHVVSLLLQPLYGVRREPLLNVQPAGRH